MTRRLLLAALVVAAAAATPASAQFNVLSPIFRDLNGGAVWGSAGGAVRSHVDDVDRRPMWRGGFAAFYGPFGGGGDTVIVMTTTVEDSTETQIVHDDGSTTRRRVGSRLETRSESKKLGRDGKVTLAAGYQHSAYYRIPGTPLTSTVAIGGLFMGAFFGPYRVPVTGRLGWYGGVGSTIVQLKDLAGRADSLAVQLTTERTLAPEFYLMLAYTVTPNYRLLLTGSYQYLRFGSVSYRTVEGSRSIPAATLETLPSEIRLETFHVTLGVSFSASSLIPAR